ncbi:MAG: hypothetical protein F9K18_08245 [Thermoanaerobaculia bacterium]|nr:MAG: hypothetical protein F9K18_08245 [Thermoanaerobaculia bacterium]
MIAFAFAIDLLAVLVYTSVVIGLAAFFRLLGRARRDPLLWKQLGGPSLWAAEAKNRGAAFSIYLTRGEYRNSPDRTVRTLGATVFVTMWVGVVGLLVLVALDLLDWWDPRLMFRRH